MPSSSASSRKAAIRSLSAQVKETIDHVQSHMAMLNDIAKKLRTLEREEEESSSDDDEDNDTEGEEEATNLPNKANKKKDNNNNEANNNDISRSVGRVSPTSKPKKPKQLRLRLPTHTLAVSSPSTKSSTKATNKTSSGTANATAATTTAATNDSSSAAAPAVHFRDGVIQLCAKTGKEVARYPSATDAARGLVKSDPSVGSLHWVRKCIGKVLRREKDSFKGLHFYRYGDEPEQDRRPPDNAESQQHPAQPVTHGGVIQICMTTNNEIARFASAAAAARDLQKQINPTGSFDGMRKCIGAVLRREKDSYEGYIYRYVDEVPDEEGDAEAEVVPDEEETAFPVDDDNDDNNHNQNDDKSSASTASSSDTTTASKTSTTALRTANDGTNYKKRKTPSGYRLPTRKAMKKETGEKEETSAGDSMITI